ncbi:ClpXP protease specificity-enhancing factor [Vibrio sp. CAU 1672]|uniref:ClpXP protease specificity-enhancing factor n=1 Tax=Vibrio sp. CAU 1672 TaxID=3032594 RepID=UPI0023DC43BB|nr:ClpXP protease specificity-enhancing factor [Vibrio sp. CAU 1672]MDF2153304.1 ClpXP protease specificity-enhancing factor [Vibrio sp. CAU 1672]
MDIAKMTARRPYMLRAFYDWLVDNDLTPHLVVDATLPGVRVPLEFVQDGQIILNIAPRAVGHLELSNDAVTFHARFSGRPHSVIVPVYAIQAIYARENGAGTMFEPEEAYTNIEQESDIEEDFSVGLTSLSDSVPADTEAEPEQEIPRPKGRPSLRVIK